MRKITCTLTIMAIAYATAAASEPPHVRLSDYAFDFPTYGYELTVIGRTSNFADRLTADDYITIEDSGYSIRTLIDRMSRKDRQGFIRFFNTNCIGFMPTDTCPIKASGDVELDENMRMIFRLTICSIRKGDAEWSNAVRE